MNYTRDSRAVVWGCCSLSLSIVIALLAIIPAGAQPQEHFEGFISGIRANAVKGGVAYQRKEGKFDLEPGLKLEEGDFIKTGANSYAELLLQPGNYLRVGEESDFQIISDPHDKMRVKLNRGAIAVEILAKDGEGSWYYYEKLSQRYELVRLITPNGAVFITQPGIFRANVMPDGRTELIVRKGEAVINGRRVKEKRRAVASGESVTISDLDTKTQDGFDLWSRERAEILVQANRSLKKEAPWAKNSKKELETTVDVPAEGEEKSKSPLVVSARPGTVNFVESGVEFSRKAAEWQPLTDKLELETGDKLRTSDHSFAELTMMPDTNLRMDGSSEILFEQLSNDAISLKLLQGSAILDVARFHTKQAPHISLVGTSTSIVIAENGNYRIDVTPNGDRVTVRDGKVTFKEKSVDACRQIVGETVSDCDRKKVDNFDFWSDHRGEGEMYNGRATIAVVTHLARLRRLRFRNTGFWFQNPGQPHYTFVPYTSPRFRSPYGGNYTTVLSPRRPLGIPGMEIGRPVFRGPQIAPRQ